MRNEALVLVALAVLVFGLIQPVNSGTHASTKEMLDALEFSIDGPAYCPTAIVGECRVQVELKNGLPESTAAYKTDIEDANLEIYYFVGESKKTMGKFEVDLKGGRETSYKKSIGVYFSSIVPESNISIVASFSLGGNYVKEISHVVGVMPYSEFKNSQETRGVYNEPEPEFKEGTKESEGGTFTRIAGIDNTVFIIVGALVVGFVLARQTSKKRR